MILFLLKDLIVVHSCLNSSSLLFHSPYSVLLAAPSFSIPSQPAALPAISSTLPNPSRLASRFALAAFIASMPACLSVAAEAFQASEPVAAPTADCDERGQLGWIEREKVRGMGDRNCDEIGM